MPNPVRQIKSGTLYLFATAVESLVPFLTLPIFTRILSVEDYGALALAQVYAVVAAGVGNFGLNTAYNRNYFEYCEDKRKTSELFYSTLGFVFILSLIIGWITYIFRHDISEGLLRSSHFGALIVWSYVNVCLINLRVYFLLYLRNVERPRQYVCNTLLLSVLNLLIPLFLVVALHWGMMGVVYGQVLAAAIVFIGLGVQFLRELPCGLSLKMLKEVVLIGGPTVPMVFFSVLSNHFDKYMIGMLSTVGGVGVYSVGQKMAMVVHTFMTSLQNVFSPGVFQRMFKGREENQKEIGQYLLPFFYMIVFFALLVILFAEEVVWIFVPKQFYGSVDIIMILTLFYVVLFFAKVNADQLVFSKKTFLITMMIIGAGLLNVALNIPFIKIWAGMGAAWATLLSRALAGVVIFYVAQKYYRIFWPVRTYLAIAGLLFIATMLLLVLRCCHADYPYRLGFKVSTISLFLWIGFNAKIINQEKIQLLLTVWNKSN